MTGNERTETILRPILQRPSRRYYIVMGLALLGLAWYAQAWAFQLQHGMIVLGIGDWGSGGGIPWGLYVGSFIWWVGIAHGGIIISAAVRLFNLSTYKPVARLAELLTLIALSTAPFYIVVHLGRPNRVVTSILPAWPKTVQTSPLAWDVTVITLYFVLRRARAPRAVSVIDFGDMLRTATVCEPAVAAAYALIAKPDPLGARGARHRGLSRRTLARRGRDRHPLPADRDAVVRERRHVGGSQGSASGRSLRHD